MQIDFGHFRKNAFERRSDYGLISLKGVDFFFAKSPMRGGDCGLIYLTFESFLKNEWHSHNLDRWPAHPTAGKR